MNPDSSKELFNSYRRLMSLYKELDNITLVEVDPSTRHKTNWSVIQRLDIRNARTQLVNDQLSKAGIDVDSLREALHILMKQEIASFKNALSSLRSELADS